MKFWLYLLLCIPLSVLAATGNSADQARLWLDKMVTAVKTLNYEGTFVYIHDGQPETMHIIHSVDQDGEHERLVSLNGTQREILRDSHNVTCILPDRRSVVVEKSQPRKYIPDGLLNAPDKLDQYYAFKLLGRGRMTGRDAQLVAVEPLDRYRYGYRLWLDAKTALLLKSDLIDENGRAVEQVMFTRLEVRDHIPAADLKPATAGRGYTWYRENSSPQQLQVSQNHWKVTQLPAGFTVSTHVEHVMPMSAQPVEHWVFSDGLASVSVYVEQLHGDDKVLKGLSRMGAAHAYGAAIDGHQVTVVGEVPQATVKMIGDSVRHQP